MSRWKKNDDEVTEAALYMREWAETEKGQEYRQRHKEYVKEWRKNNPEKFHAAQKRAYQKVRLEALQKYSQKEIPECRCCGESMLEFLHIDHIEGNGAAHRREIGMRQGIGQTYPIKIGANAFPYWLKKNDYPEGFQVLCANCNIGKRTNKYCPHELQRGVDMDGNVIPSEFYPEPISVMPKTKGPERDEWLESPEGLRYRAKISKANTGKPSPKNTQVDVECASCNASLKRKKCEVERKRNKDGDSRFFCNQKCAGKWKRENLTGAKVYNNSEPLEFICGYVECGKKVFRKKHQLRPNQTVVYCGNGCKNKAAVGKTPWNKGLVQHA